MKKNSKISRTINLLLLISVILTVYTIRNTYAKYQDKLGTSYNAGMQGWFIKLNNSDIYDNKYLTEFMTPVFCNDIASYATENIFVPGSEQYLQFVVDYSKVDVKFEFKIKIEELTENKLEFFDIEGYTSGNLTEYTSNIVDNKENINESINENYVIDEIIDAPNLEEKIKYYKVYVQWNDEKKDQKVVVNGNRIEKNRYDTTYAGNTIPESTRTKIFYKVDVTFEQIVENEIKNMID